MKSPTFGFDIGTTALKAVWLEHEEAKTNLLSCISFPTPEHGMQSESPLDQEVMVNAIKQLLTDAKITARSAHIALAENQVFTKVIEMPVLSEKELSSAIKWEAEQYIPASLATMTLDNVILRQVVTAEGPRMLVLLVAAPTALITRYQRVLGMAGISIASIETEILSIVRAAIPSVNPPTSLILHIGSLSTSFAIVQQGVLIFTYSIPIGSIAIDRAIATDFGLSIEQAEEYKRTYGIADQNLNGKIGKAVAPILSSIMSETKKALAFYKYYKEKYNNEFPIQQLILSGGTAELPGMTAYFSEQSGIESSVINPFVTRQIGSVPREVMTSGPEFGTAVGLAMKEYE